MLTLTPGALGGLLYNMNSTAPFLPAIAKLERIGLQVDLASATPGRRPGRLHVKATDLRTGAPTAWTLYTDGSYLLQYR